MHSIKLIDSREIATGTMEFRFTKPDTFTYRAGQSVDLTLQSQLMHPYSLASAPHEDHLTIATRMRDSAFKKELGSMMVNSAATIDGPFGSFFLHDNADRPAIFLVGGIGVTPFLSIVTDAAKRNLPHQMYMLFGNKTPGDAPYVPELEALQAAHPCFMLKNVFGARIDADTVTAFAPTDKNPVYYMAGPIGMVTAMRTLLNGMGVSDDDIRFEEFSGY